MGLVIELKDDTKDEYAIIIDTITGDKIKISAAPQSGERESRVLIDCDKKYKIYRQSIWEKLNK